MCIISCKVYGGIKKEDRNFMRLIWNRLKDFWHYRDLLKQRIIRDIKLKYRRSGVSLECLKSAVFDACDDHCILTDVPSEYREFSGILRVVYWQECWNN